MPVRHIVDSVIDLGLDRRFAIDIGSVLMQLRKFGLLHIPSDLETKVKHLLQNLGLVVIAQRHLSRQIDSESRECTLRSIKSSQIQADDWVEVWFALRFIEQPNINELFDNTGMFLGYPTCCIEFHNSQYSLAGFYEDYLFSSKDRYWEINRLATIFSEALFMPDFFPCSLSCSSAHSFGLKHLNVARELFDKNTIESWINDLQAPITLWGDRLIKWSNWHFEKNILYVESPHACAEQLTNILKSNKFEIQLFDTPKLIKFKHLGTANKISIRLANGQSELLLLT